jgi:hypothetical protein
MMKWLMMLRLDIIVGVLMILLSVPDNKDSTLAYSTRPVYYCFTVRAIEMQYK